MARRNKSNGFKIVKMVEGVDVENLEPFDNQIYLTEIAATLWFQKYLTEDIFSINTHIVIPATHYDKVTYPPFKHSLKELKEKIDPIRADLLRKKANDSKNAKPDYTQWQTFDEKARRGDAVLNLEKFLRNTFTPDDMLALLITRKGLLDLKYFSIERNDLSKRFCFWKPVWSVSAKPPVLVFDYASNSLVTFDQIAMWRKVKLGDEIKLIV